MLIIKGERGGNGGNKKRPTLGELSAASSLITGNRCDHVMNLVIDVLMPVLLKTLGDSLGDIVGSLQRFQLRPFVSGRIVL